MTVSSPSLTFRSHRPGDMGYITYRHGVLYAQEYGWGSVFEALVGRITADFAENFDPAKEQCWIAEVDGQFAGSIFIVNCKDLDNTARVRVLLVEPTARGLGVGRQLVQKCVDFAREKGYGRVVLSTQAQLVSARRIYSNAGFELTEEKQKVAFIPGETTGETWELDLTK